MRINGTHVNDSGIYVCEVSHGNTHSEVELRLIVNDPATVIEAKQDIVQGPPGVFVHRVTTTEWSQVLLECVSESIPEDKNEIEVIRWFKVSAKYSH